MTAVQLTQPLDLREKLLTDGVRSLSDTELLAIFISSGSQARSCLQLAYDLMKHLGDLRGVLNADLQSFTQIRGLGDVRYVQLQAMKEICRRSDYIHLKKELKISSTQQTYAYLKKRLRDQKNEIFAALFLDSQYRIIAYEELFYGTINYAIIHPRPIITRILQHNAAAIILAHNHPSGISYASHEDMALTARIKDALKLIDTQLLDHIVIGDNEIYSITAENKWKCGEHLSDQMQA